MFDNVPFDGVSTRGICNSCHSGPMLNRAAAGNPFGLPPGGLRAGIGVSERNLIGNPLYSFVVTNQDGSVVVIDPTPDPGAMLEQSAPEGAARGADTSEVLLCEPLQNPAAVGCKGHGSVLPRQLREDARGRRGALRILLPHQSESTTGFVFTQQDQADMVAFLKLLR